MRVFDWEYPHCLKSKCPNSYCTQTSIIWWKELERIKSKIASLSKKQSRKIKLVRKFSKQHWDWLGTLSECWSSNQCLMGKERPLTCMIFPFLLWDFDLVRKKIFLVLSPACPEIYKVFNDPLFIEWVCALILDEYWMEIDQKNLSALRNEIICRRQSPFQPEVYLLT